MRLAPYHNPPNLGKGFNKYDSDPHDATNNEDC